jgi:hypothetical protein
MAILLRTYSAASCSWINPVTGLPENDFPIIANSLQRSFLIGNHGFRFCNFIEAWVKIDDIRRMIIDWGFSRASGVYRAPSYLMIPSHAFSTIQDVSQIQDGVRFTQIAGARTVSAEASGALGGVAVGAAAGAYAGTVILPGVGTLAGAGLGAVVGGLAGETVAHQGVKVGDLPPLGNFPPIWSKVAIAFYKDGRVEAEVLQYSLFPSLTFYTQTIGANGTPRTLFERTDLRDGNSSYDAKKAPELGRWQSLGWGLSGRSRGPSAGNPWGISKGLMGGSENIPN